MITVLKKMIIKKKKEKDKEKNARLTRLDLGPLSHHQGFITRPRRLSHLDSAKSFNLHNTSKVV